MFTCALEQKHGVQGVGQWQSICLAHTKVWDLSPVPEREGEGIRESLITADLSLADKDYIIWDFIISQSKAGLKQTL